MSKKRKEAPRISGANLVIVSTIFYASYGVWTTLIGNFFGGYAASTWRSLIVLCMLVPIAIKYHQLEQIRWRQDKWYLFGLIVSVTLIWGPLYFAILHDGIGVASAVNYASVLISLFLFGKLFAGEHFTRDKAIATLLGIVGICLVFSPNLSRLGWLGLGAAVLSGIGDALNSVVSQHISYNATQSSVLIWLGSAVANLGMALATRQRLFIGLNHVQWFYMFIFGTCSLFASWLVTAGLKKVEAGVAGMLGLLEIAFSIGFGLIFFHEHFQPIMFIGVGSILAAAAMPQLTAYIKRGISDEVILSAPEDVNTITFESS